MKIDIKKQVSKQEIDELCETIGTEAYTNICHKREFTDYNGQINDLRKLLVESVSKEELPIAAALTDAQVHQVFFHNLYIPTTVKGDSETIYLIPLEVLKTCEKLER